MTQFALTLEDALKANEMATLGDLMLGTVPPLVLRLLATAGEPCFPDRNGEINLRIGGVEFYGGGGQVDDKTERQLMLYLMTSGGWNEVTDVPSLADGRVISVDISLAPEQWDRASGFAIVGFLSSMISDRYRWLTAPTGIVKRLSPLCEPSSLGILLPANYAPKELRLWRFKMQPS